MFRVAARATRTASHGEGIGTRKWCPAVSVRVDSLVSALQVGTRWKEQMRGILAFLAVLLVIGFVAEYWRMLLALCFIGVAVACAIAWMPTVTRAAGRKWAVFQQPRRQQREQVRRRLACFPLAGLLGFENEGIAPVAVNAPSSARAIRVLEINSAFEDVIVERVLFPRHVGSRQIESDA